MYLLRRTATQTVCQNGTGVVNVDPSSSQTIYVLR